jgi:hypothetical protein
MPISSAMRSAGLMNCQADMPDARAITSSSRRERLRKEIMPASNMQKGRRRSVICGTR